MEIEKEPGIGLNNSLRQNKKDLLNRFENFEYYDDVDLDKKEDLQLNPKILEQLKDIDEKIEVIGKVCDKQYKNSYNMLKSILDKENEKVDNNIKSYISNFLGITFFGSLSQLKNIYFISFTLLVSHCIKSGKESKDLQL